jgi:phage major head subunit gpT-like protein
MSLSKSDKLNEVNRTLVTTYNEVFSNVKSNVSELVSNQPTPTKKFVHAFVAGYPKMREWKGEKVPKTLKIEEIVGETKPYEDTVEIDVDDMLSPIVRPLLSIMEGLGSQAATHVDQLLASFLQNGTSTAAEYLNYDGGALFATHTLDDGTTQSNNLTSTALSATNLRTAITTMMGFKDPLGNPMKLVPTHLIVPSALYYTAKALVETPIDASGATNVLFNVLKIVRLPELDSQTTTWYVACVQGSSTPFVNYELQSPELTSLVGPESENVFWKDKQVFSVTAKRSVKAGPWQLLLRAIA